MEKVKYLVATQEELEQTKRKFGKFLQQSQGIDLHYCLDMSTPDRRWFVPKGNGQPHWAATNKPVRTITSLDEFEFVFTDKTLNGIIWEGLPFGSRIVDIDPTSDKAYTYNLRELPHEYLKELVDSLHNFFEQDAREVASEMKEGDSFGIKFPWCRHFHHGNTAVELDMLFRGMHEQLGSFHGSWGEIFEDNIPEDLIIQNDPCDGCSWWIDRVAGDCAHCGVTITMTDVKNNACPHCGRNPNECIYCVTWEVEVTASSFEEAVQRAITLANIAETNHLDVCTSEGNTHLFKVGLKLSEVFEQEGE